MGLTVFFGIFPWNISLFKIALIMITIIFRLCEKERRKQRIAESADAVKRARYGTLKNLVLRT